MPRSVIWLDPECVDGYIGTVWLALAFCIGPNTQFLA